MCGQCQRILKLPEHVDAHYSPPREPPLVQTAQNLHGVRPPPGFGGPAATQLSVVACICPSCSSVVQAPLSAPICKCGNCGQPMRVPTAIA
ncbi:predicted protein [Ostreococcus lucimarinus CCE9901]|uniref:Uncharacterized protein n=1 Tax=Ostreococcus lucimarinus (strain CCE9901) TaxID=436017 RepID=A4RUS7_OSTLU|nr:predicted protein [Ostreococcus lucimarinus CCE9901]ABO95017.1 predicted protein [Ostreococcus lucimarinus CCE9901]|eukprot:XP_001416724.1 predicted protein [Ostreococcus lucimarinus CCE9901]